MTKIINLKQLESANPGFEPEVSPAAGDFLGRVRGTIIEFKELLKLVQEMRGIGASDSDSQALGRQADNPGPGTGKAAIVKYLAVAVQKGHGDTTIGALLKEIEPFTLRQVLEFIKRV